MLPFTQHQVSLHTDLGEQNQQQLMFYHIQHDYLESSTAAAFNNTSVTEAKRCDKITQNLPSFFSGKMQHNHARFSL